MRSSRFATLAASAFVVLAFAEPVVAQSETVAYRGATVWSDGQFAPRDLLVRDGRFVDDGEPVRTVDLAGTFVVPAYANAHAHITNPDRETSDYYLRNGVFYVWNTGSVVMDSKLRGFFARPDTYDVKFAFGAITEPGGHPEKLYVDILTQYVYPGKPREWFDGNAFHYGRTDEEVDAALALLDAQGADFVKAILVFSEDYDLRRDDPEFYGMKGMGPSRVLHLVDAAKRIGKPVAFHVESVEDLLAAASAGGFMAAHLPGYGYKEPGEDLATITLSPMDAKLVAASGMLLVPTYSLAKVSYAADPAPAARSIALHFAAQASNLRQLDRAGARFAIGTDQQGEIFTEVEHLASLSAFDDRKLLWIVLETGSKLFPERRIGCFEPGCEADFLALSEDPSCDLTALRKIVLAVKGGIRLAFVASTD